MQKLHLISFNNPYPPDYGGVMDVYYKIKALKDRGIGVILHVFEYGRPRSPELEKLCETVYYYPRKTEWLSQVSLLPYIVKSRRSDELLANLSKDQFPILFEGLHTCFYLDHPSLKGRQKLVRMHNVEHEYYSHLAKSSSGLKNRMYYFAESIRLRRFEKILKHADFILSISQSDSEYFENKYGKTLFTGAFHPNQNMSSLSGKGSFILMHGDLSVEDNDSSILHCIRNIFEHLSFPVVIAGRNPTDRLRKEISLHKDIILAENPTEPEMDRLQHEAHVHLCYTLQASGMKLKLLNALYKGRFVVANPLMTKGSGLDDLVEVGKTDYELRDILNRLIHEQFDTNICRKREELLFDYNNDENAAKINKILR